MRRQRAVSATERGQERQVVSFSEELRMALQSPASNREGATAPDAVERTFMYQDTLPRVPLPSLEDTSRRFLEWCDPIVVADELQATKAALAAFTRKGGPAERLHAALVEYDQRPDAHSWLDLFWTTRYLGRRDRIALNANFFALFPDPGTTQTERAAGLVAGALYFKRLVDEERLPVARLRGSPLCMLQYKYLFSATRIPGSVQDTVRAPYSQRNPGPSRARHILVFHKGHMVGMDVIGSEGRPHTLQEIQRGLDAIIAGIETPAPTEESVGHLTTLARAEWAAARAELLQAHPDNTAALDTVETALFNVCLDEAAPADHLMACNNLLYGSSANRWYDKAISLIVAANGVAGINGEHCLLDGMSILSFCDALHTQGAATVSAQSCALSQGMPFTAPVRFVLPSALRTKTRMAAQSYKEYGEATESLLFTFDDFGASRVKEWRLSPDAFAQLAFQLAHVRTKGFVGATYESIATRQFKHGRTEAMRVVTPEIITFTAAMQSRTASTTDKLAAMRAAADRHVARARECQEGKAPEQHLWELQLIQKRRGAELGVTEELAFFKSPGWLKLRHDYLSTSSVQSNVIRQYGFGSTSPDCIGVGYAVRSDSFCAYLSTPKPVVQHMLRFAENLLQAMREMGTLLQTQTP
jgi:carnitine O-acetyltransferase